MFFTSVLLITVSSCLVAAEKYPFCDEGNNVGLKKEFGPLPARLGAGYVEQVRKGEPVEFCLGGVWENYFFRYTEMKKFRSSDNSVYAYHTVTYKYGDDAKVIDYLRVQVRRWQQVANAILETNKPQDDGGILKIKYLLNNCDCLMRIYDLNQINVVDTATTANCDGTEVTNSQLLLIHRPGSIQVPNCERGLNPGIFRFSTLAMKFLTHTREPLPSATKIQDFSIDYGTCSDRVVLGQIVPIYCYTIRYKGRKVDTLLSKPYDDVSGMIRVKGYDYTAGFHIYPITNPQQLKIKYLTDDCSCFVIIYTVPASGLIRSTFDKAPCETFDQSSAGLWSPPVKAEPREEKEKGSCFG